MISVIIVTYNSSEHIAKCLASLEAHRGSSIGEIIVVDNASSDGTAERVRQQFPGVKLIAAERNLGFAAASNRGASQSSGSSLLFLNPDAELHGPVAELERALENAPDIVAAAPRLVDEHGQTQVGFNVRRLPRARDLIFEILLLNRLFPDNPVNRRYRCLDFDHTRPAEVEQPAGACLLVRRSSFEGCGGFDERFFPLWFEDVDLCLRLREYPGDAACGGEAQASGRILFCPQVQVVHSGGHSLESITFSERQVYWYRNLLYYVHKHFPWTAGIAVRAALLCGMTLRLAAELPGLLMSSPARGQRVCAYWKAAKLSFQGWK